VEKGGLIADVGCGIGLLALAMKNLGYQVRGYDKYVFTGDDFYDKEDSEFLMKIWQENDLEIISADILTDPLPEKSFAGVISIATLEHQAYPRVFLEKISSLLRSGGWVYLATPNIAIFLNRLRFLFGRSPLSNINEFYQQSTSFSGHWREYVLSELVFMVKSVGLNIEEAKNVGIINNRINFNKKFFRKCLLVLGNYLPSLKDTIFVFARRKG
jgi:2-polyprenyl-3-methyl-5-hydroxy-6-metoxy-1,4-benzoquinol methylase